jgi:hypothetical protein
MQLEHVVKDAHPKTALAAKPWGDRWVDFQQRFIYESKERDVF